MVVLHIFNLSIPEAKAEAGGSQIEDCLVYKASAQTARVVRLRKTLSQRNKKRKKKENANL